MLRTVQVIANDRAKAAFDHAPVLATSDLASLRRALNAHWLTFRRGAAQRREPHLTKESTLET